MVAAAIDWKTGEKKHTNERVPFIQSVSQRASQSCYCKRLLLLLCSLLRGVVLEYFRGRSIVVALQSLLLLSSSFVVVRFFVQRTRRPRRPPAIGLFWPHQGMTLLGYLWELVRRVR